MKRFNPGIMVALSILLLSGLFITQTRKDYSSNFLANEHLLVEDIESENDCNNFYKEIQALNQMDEFTISLRDRFKFFYLIWEIEKKIRPNYNLLFIDILQRHDMHQNNIDTELDRLWKEAYQKVSPKYEFLMYLNGPIEMIIEQWQVYKVYALGYAHKICRMEKLG